MPSAPGPSPFTDHKESVRVASVADIVLNNLPDEIDGVTMSYGDRFLAKDQDDAAENGIYIWLGEDETGEVTTGGRDGQLTSGALVIVEEGDTHSDTVWLLATDDPIEVGETELTFVEVGASGGGGGVQLTDDNVWTGENEFQLGVKAVDDDLMAWQSGDSFYRAALSSDGSLYLGDGTGTYADLYWSNGAGGSTVTTGYDMQCRNLITDQGINTGFINFEGDFTANLHGTGSPGLIEVLGNLQQSAAPLNGDSLTNKDYVDSVVGSVDESANYNWTGDHLFDMQIASNRGVQMNLPSLSYPALGIRSAGDGDVENRLQILGDGSLTWSDGTTQDLSLYRDAAGVLKTDGNFVVGEGVSLGANGVFDASSGSAPGHTFRAGYLADVDTRFAIDRSGEFEWGDGTNPYDTNLYRSGYAELKTTAKFITEDSISILGSTGLLIGPAEESSIKWGGTSLDFDSPTKFEAEVGFYGTTPVGQQATAPAATDLATVITLANTLRTALNNIGITA